MSTPPNDIREAVHAAVHETVAATIRAWTEEITASELQSEEVRGTLRPLLTALVRRELEAALKPQKNGRKR